MIGTPTPPANNIIAFPLTRYRIATFKKFSGLATEQREPKPATHRDGTPLGRGDTVLFKLFRRDQSPDIKRGVVTDISILRGNNPKVIYSVMGMDGIHRLIDAHHIAAEDIRPAHNFHPTYTD